MVFVCPFLARCSLHRAFFTPYSLSGGAPVSKTGCRWFRSYRALRECIIRICEQEDRLEAVQKEIYEPIAETQHCKWKAVQGVVRRAAKLAWEVNPDAVRVMAVYPLTGCPSAGGLREPRC